MDRCTVHAPRAWTAFGAGAISFRGGAIIAAAAVTAILMVVLFQPVCVNAHHPENGDPVLRAGLPGTGRKPIRALLFDMDNTLFDLVGAQMTACNAVTRSLGVDEPDLLFPYFLRPARGFESHENILDFMQDRGIPHDGAYDRARRIYEEE